MEIPWLLFDDDDGPEAALRLRKEFEESDPRLRALSLEIGYWQYATWGVPLVITSIARSLEEALKMGRALSAHHKRDGQRFHRAADWRNRDLTLAQQQERRERIQNNYNWKVPMLFHVLDHDSGHGGHTHVNINYPYML